MGKVIEQVARAIDYEEGTELVDRSIQQARAAIKALIDEEWEGKYCFELSDEVIPGQYKGRPATYQELAKYMLKSILEEE